MHLFHPPEDLEPPLAPPRFWVPLAVLVLLLGIYALTGLWLEARVDWPEVANLHCHYRACGWIALSKSGSLFRRSGYDLMYFAWMWAGPAIGLSSGVFVLVRRWWRRRQPS
ncbi:hypothetical protein WG907_09400 [Sphingobium sp. AN558]|uniref:hypothetical protein n=1 Tax=Sphingobium sp. AN558 TaxID=3133442 RepID=UPI0030C09B30